MEDVFNCFVCSDFNWESRTFGKILTCMATTKFWTIKIVGTEKVENSKSNRLIDLPAVIRTRGVMNENSFCPSHIFHCRYFVVDLQLCMTTMESGVYDKVAEYLSLMGRTELLTCSAMQNSFGTIRDQAKQLTRDYNLQCCYLYYPVLKQHIQYEFESCDDDPVDHVTAEHDSASATLSKEARRWATKIARENNNIREYVRKLQIYNALREAGQKVRTLFPLFL